ncbi:hypothetical protein ANN_15100 [Periplaneta americana]|uniref:Uncharacterized protein n=1 Tax=Periplaneta americana TaxID=6978 RepID=A0ABQ8SZI3_PERAM|nr:hypothetical protein ANN_15100 [Periplaneta americana]
MSGLCEGGNEPPGSLKANNGNNLKNNAADPNSSVSVVWKLLSWEDEPSWSCSLRAWVSSHYVNVDKDLKPTFVSSAEKPYFANTWFAKTRRGLRETAWRYAKAAWILTIKRNGPTLRHLLLHRSRSEEEDSCVAFKADKKNSIDLIL